VAILTGIVIAANAGVVGSVPAVAAPDPSLVGQWSAPVDVGIVGMHAALMHTGEVLLYYRPVDGVGSEARVLDPVTNEVTDVSLDVELDIHCSVTTILPDGRVLAAGGTVYGEPASHDGTTTVLIFDPDTLTWSESGPLAEPRWYPTAVQLGDGTTLIATGEVTIDQLQPSAESFDPVTGTSTLLPATANSATDPYAHLFLLPSGKVFRAIPNQDSRRFIPSTNTWSSWNAPMNFGWRYGGVAVLLPGLRKVLAVGGSDNVFADRAEGDPATASAEIIDLGVPSPAWSYTGSMKYARIHPNLVLLPDGKALVVGGAAANFNQGPVRTPELYTPWTGTWRTMATQSADRGYHSTALLLPDGRVLSAGSNVGNLPTTVDYFSPPYLFRGPRPTITSAPASVGYGETLTIETPDADSISKVVLIRPGATTHATDFDQRMLRLPFTRGAGTITATVPSSPNRLPPGYYMLFILDSSGVPAVAPFVQVA
jgi:hypothetical protein